MSAELLQLPPSAPAQHRPRPWLLLFGVLVLVAGCYMPVLGAPFLWDDTHLIELPLVRELAPLRDYFQGSFWQHDEVGMVHSYYRPLAILSLALDHHFYGDNSSGFHVTNLVFHLAATGVLFRILRQDGASGFLAALGSALWALMPRLTEAAAWVSGRTDVLAGFFVLCALLAQRSAFKLARWSTPVWLLLGLFCKETALAGVLAVLVGQWQSTQQPSRRLRRLAPTALMFIGYAALRLHAVGFVVNLIHVSPLKRILAVGEALGRYLCMVLVPWFPDVQIGNLERRVVTFVVLGGLLLCALIAWFWRKGRHLKPMQASYLALTAGSLGLALLAIPFSISAVAADRFLYLPLAGLVLLVMPVIGRCASRWRGGPFVALAVVGSFAVATFERASTWADEVEFWTTTLRRHPEEPSMASLALASAFSREGLFAQSLAVLHRAAQPGMDVAELARRNTGMTLLRAGDYQRARRVFSNLLAEHPADPVYAVDLALAEMSLNRFDQARQTLDRGLNAAPWDASARGLRGRLEKLESERQQLDSWPPSAPFAARARLEVALGLKIEALRSFALVLADPNVTPALAEEALRFALRSGDAANREVFFRRYVALVGGRTDPQLQLAYDTHRECLAKLERVWPTLGLTL